MGSHSLLQGTLPNPGVKPRSPALQADSLSSEPPGKLMVAVNSWCSLPLSSFGIFPVCLSLHMTLSSSCKSISHIRVHPNDHIITWLHLQNPYFQVRSLSQVWGVKTSTLSFWGAKLNHNRHPILYHFVTLFCSLFYSLCILLSTVATTSQLFPIFIFIRIISIFHTPVTIVNFEVCKCNQKREGWEMLCWVVSRLK